MSKFVTPKVHLVGYTSIDFDGLRRYLYDTGNDAFADSVAAAKKQGLSDGEVICSFYAKLCYASLTVGHNDNVTRVRDIPDNLRSVFDTGHGSVLEHASINFVASRCSRVFEAELIRHRVGTAFSILSGRYERTSELSLVIDPILEPLRDRIEPFAEMIERAYNELVAASGLDGMKDFDAKKKMTSALRRLLPQGKSREIGFSVNLRSLRHLVQLRTSRHAEWEIREVFSQVYRLVKEKFPLVFYGAKEDVVDGIIEVSGMKMNPYDKAG